LLYLYIKINFLKKTKIMGKLKPIGSEKLQGMDKIRRIIEISNFNLNVPNSINETSSDEFKKTLADGNTYHIVKEKSGYVIKVGLYESTSDYIEPMKHRKYYPSYSQALKRLNIITKEINANEGYDYNLSLFNESDKVKYYLKTEQNEQAQQQAPPPAPAPQPTQQQAPPAPQPQKQTPPPPSDEMGDDDMDFDMDMDMEDEEPQDEPTPEEGGDDKEVVTYKTIQKLVGRLGQKTREFLSDEENELDSKQMKYIINSILSALPINSLDEEDRDEIMTKFEGVEDMGDMEGEDMGVQPPPAPPAPETAESYHYKRMGSRNIKDRSNKMKEVIENIFSESKVDKVLSRYIEPLQNKNNTVRKIENLSETHRQEKKSIGFYNKFKDAKFLGKSKVGNLVFEYNHERFRITPNGEILWII